MTCFILEIVCRIYFSKKYFLFRFCCEEGKVRAFLNIIDLSFDERLGKYYGFSLHSCKTVAINNIKLKCSQFLRQMFDVPDHAFNRKLHTN